MYKPLVIKSEFAKYVRLSLNISDASIEMHIKDMQELTFKATTDATFYNDLIGSLTSRPELSAFLDTYIKPYLICGAYEKFLLWHGTNINQYGLRQNNEDTSDEISDKRRAEIMADIRSKANAYLSIMQKQLKEDNYTFDGVYYNFCDNPTKQKRNIGFKQA